MTSKLCSIIVFSTLHIIIRNKLKSATILQVIAEFKYLEHSDLTAKSYQLYKIQESSILYPTAVYLYPTFHVCNSYIMVNYYITCATITVFKPVLNIYGYNKIKQRHQKLFT